MHVFTTGASLLASALTIHAAAIAPSSIATGSIATGSISAQESGAESGDPAVGEPVEAPRLRSLDDLLQRPVVIADGGERARARLAELVVLPGGHCEWAVLAHDDREVIVPTERLTWRPADRTFHARLSAEELGAQPSFDLAAARREGLFAAVERSRVAWKLPARVEAVDALPNDPAPVFLGTSFQVATRDVVLASELTDLAVLGRSERFGDVGTAFADPVAMRVDLLTVEVADAEGSTARLVPMEALTLCRGVTKVDETSGEQDLILSSSRPVSELVTAPLFVEPADPDVAVTRANRHEAYVFFRLLPERTSAD